VVADIDHDDSRVAMIRTLAEFAGRTDAFLIAEGIERSEQLEALVRLRVPLGQGYALGKPTPAMTEVDREVSARVRHQAGAEASAAGVGHLAEPVPHLPRGADREAVAEAFAHEPRAPAAVLVDERGVPVALVERAGFLRGEDSSSAVPLAVPRMTAPAEAARRAMTRSRAERYHPIVILDELGRSTGVVQIDVLIDRLTR
jgi:hypothetical protein